MLNAHCCHELLETNVYVSYVILCRSNNHPTATEYPLLENKKYSSGTTLLKIIQQKLAIITLPKQKVDFLQQCIKFNVKKVVV